MKSWILFLLISLTYSAQAQYETAQSVPNPKSNGNGYVSNPDNVLSPNTVLQINQHLAKLEQLDEYQVAVVCLNSIGNNVPDDFALELGENWGVGTAGKDDGVIVLMVMDQRIISMKTGYGTEKILTDLLTQSIQQEEMVPLFKQGNYDQGMLSGVMEICNVLRGNPIEEEPDDLKKRIDAINNGGTTKEVSTTFGNFVEQKENLFKEAVTKRNDFLFSWFNSIGNSNGANVVEEFDFDKLLKSESNLNRALEEAKVKNDFSNDEIIQLKGFENRMAVEKKRWIEAISQYNSHLEAYPDKTKNLDKIEYPD